MEKGLFGALLYISRTYVQRSDRPGGLGEEVTGRVRLYRIEGEISRWRRPPGGEEHPEWPACAPLHRRP